MNIVVFEDGLHDNFYPLSLTRPLWELRSGLYSFRERLELFVERLLGAGCSIYYFTRDYLAPYYREKYPQLSINDHSVFKQDKDILFLNAVKYPARPYSIPEKTGGVGGGPVRWRPRSSPSRIPNPGEPIPAMIANCTLSLS